MGQSGDKWFWHKTGHGEYLKSDLILTILYMSRKTSLSLWGNWEVFLKKIRLEADLEGWEWMSYVCVWQMEVGKDTFYLGLTMEQG